MEYLMLAGETALAAKAGGTKTKQAMTQVKPRSGLARRSLNLYDGLAGRELGMRVFAGRGLVDLLYA
jgi:hypothetical protein